MMITIQFSQKVNKVTLHHPRTASLFTYPNREMPFGASLFDDDGDCNTEPIDKD